MLRELLWTAPMRIGSNWAIVSLGEELERLLKRKLNKSDVELERVALTCDRRLSVFRRQTNGTSDHDIS